MDKIKVNNNEFEKNDYKKLKNIGITYNWEA